MKKMITENGVKIIVECELRRFVFTSATLCVAHVERTTEHPRLGEANGLTTITSSVLNIDFQNRHFETENTVYRWY